MPGEVSELSAELTLVPSWAMSVAKVVSLELRTVWQELLRSKERLLLLPAVATTLMALQ